MNCNIAISTFLAMQTNGSNFHQYELVEPISPYVILLEQQVSVKRDNVILIFRKHIWAQHKICFYTLSQPHLFSSFGTRSVDKVLCNDYTPPEIFYDSGVVMYKEMVRFLVSFEEVNYTACPCNYIDQLKINLSTSRLCRMIVEN